MRFYLISDNSDAMNGLRLAGIEGTVARSEADLRAALAAVAQQPDIGMVLVTEKTPTPLRSTPCARTRTARCWSRCRPPAVRPPARTASRATSVKRSV